MLYSASKARNLNFTAGIFKHASEANNRFLFIIDFLGMKRVAGLFKITFLTQKLCLVLSCLALLLTNNARLRVMERHRNYCPNGSYLHRYYPTNRLSKTRRHHNIILLRLVLLFLQRWKIIFLDNVLHELQHEAQIRVVTNHQVKCLLVGLHSLLHST